MTFKREERYYVLKISDMCKYLSREKFELVGAIAEKLNAGRAVDGKSLLQAVVIEHDWPEYERAWQMIERRMVGTHSEDKPAAYIPTDALEQMRPPMLLLRGVTLLGYMAEGTTAVYTSALQRDLAQPAQEPHLFELWWSKHMPEATQEQAWKAWISAPQHNNVGVAKPEQEPVAKEQDAAQSAWDVLKPNLAPKDWTASECNTYQGFFNWGWEAARKYYSKKEPVSFLANGMRFKVSYTSQGGGEIYGLPSELAGRWVALVAAENGCHLELKQPRPERETVEALRRVMARLADLLDEDQFAEIEGIVAASGVTPPQSKNLEHEPVAIVSYETFSSFVGSTQTAAGINFLGDAIPNKTTLYKAPQQHKSLTLSEINDWIDRRLKACGPDGVTDIRAFAEECISFGDAHHIKGQV